MDQPEQPLDPHAPHPARCLGLSPGLVVEGCADREDHAVWKSVEVVEDPQLLARHAHTDEQDIGGERADLFHHGCILDRARCRVEVAVADLDLRPGMKLAEPQSRFVHDLRCTADIHDPPAVAVRQTPEMVAPVQISAAVKGPTVQAEHLGKVDQGSGINFHQIGAVKEAL